TNKREFTLDEKLRAELSKLTGETTIIVHRRQASIGPQGRADPYAVAADKKIIEKVRDLVEQFQELGPRFRVQNLDIDEFEQYDESLAKIREDSPALGAAIASSPENSIFFYSVAYAKEEGAKKR